MTIAYASTSLLSPASSSVRESERQIAFIKNFFAQSLEENLNLQKISAPLFVEGNTGVNDDLNGVELPVKFAIKNFGQQRSFEIIQSLAKWKRMMLQHYGFAAGEGLYTDMRALRPQDVVDSTHSVMVDQWDWEKHITAADRNLQFLKDTVTKIYASIRNTEIAYASKYQAYIPCLPEEITFVHTEDLQAMYPKLTPQEREFKICEQHKAVFLIGIGYPLSDGQPHDGRAPDYDDWSTPNQHDKCRGLNGDILVWHPQLKSNFELSSMGIRVDTTALLEQVKIRKCESRLELPFHRYILDNKIPLSMGGGIGQSRLCMFIMRKEHIGEVQPSVWA